ncbi:MAG: hypothetical protein AAF735_03880 [Myxococcota bacterium]
MISGAISNPDSTTTVLAPVSSLDEPSEVPVDNAVAIECFGIAWAREGAGELFLNSFESLSIEKFELQGGSLVRTDTLGLQARGVTGGGRLIFVSDTKAYFLEFGAGNRLITWDPTRMEITGEIDLPFESPEGFDPVVGGDEVALRDDGILLMSVMWLDEDGVAIADQVGVITVDTNTDTFIDISLDERCGSLWFAQSVDDGTTYLTGLPNHGVYRLFDNELGTNPCQLRVVPPNSSFDESYFVDLEALTDGRPTGEVILLNDDRAVMRVFHPEDAADSEDIFEYTFQTAYRWWVWDIEQNTAAPIPGQQVGSLSARRFRIDGQYYIQAEQRLDAEMNPESTVQRFDSDSGEIREGPTFPGQIRNVFRLR